MAEIRKHSKVKEQNKAKILVVIPAYNEEETIQEVVERTIAYADVSVTDDGSKDRTPSILASIQKNAKKYKHSLHVITHPRSTHIPLGVQDGLKYGVLKKYDFIITMDAGLSHDPDLLPEFINEDPSFDVVIGMRANVLNVPLYRRLISKMAAIVVNYAISSSWLDLRGPGLKDCTSGWRRYSFRAASLISEAQLVSKAFDFHMEALALCIRNGYRAKEIPITYVFSNSSFNMKVLKLAMKFALYLLKTKG